MRAGQAVVQFVRAPQTNDVYAMKLFTSRRVFEDERRLYLNSGLASFMPTVVEFVENEDGAFRDPHGGNMPPALVMEKGETLTERIHRCKNNIFTTIQVRDLSRITAMTACSDHPRPSGLSEYRSTQQPTINSRLLRSDRGSLDLQMQPDLSTRHHQALTCLPPLPLLPNGWFPFDRTRICCVATLLMMRGPACVSFSSNASRS